VVARYHIQATHAGPLLGAPPSGRTITWQACDFVRVAGGKVVERWFLADLLVMTSGPQLLALLIWTAAWSWPASPGPRGWLHYPFVRAASGR
jgi:hypothetical protein